MYMYVDKTSYVVGRYVSRSLCGNTRIEYKNNSVLLKPKTEFGFN